MRRIILFLIIAILVGAIPDIYAGRLDQTDSDALTSAWLYCIIGNKLAWIIVLHQFIETVAYLHKKAAVSVDVRALILVLILMRNTVVFELFFDGMFASIFQLQLNDYVGILLCISQAIYKYYRYVKTGKSVADILSL